MWALFCKWAAILFPVVWHYVRPLLENSKLRDDLKWVLPIAEDVVGIVERTSRSGTPGSTKAGRATALISRTLRNENETRAATIPDRTIKKAIELALEVAPATATLSTPDDSAGGMPVSDDTEQAGTEVSP